MALTTNQKTKVRAALHRAYSVAELVIPWTKPEADLAITDADNWIDSNAASFASALSQPFRGSSTAADKSVLLITLAIAQRLASDPGYTAVLKSILSEFETIQGA